MTKKLLTLTFVGLSTIAQCSSVVEELKTAKHTVSATAKQLAENAAYTDAWREFAGVNVGMGQKCKEALAEKKYLAQVAANTLPGKVATMALGGTAIAAGFTGVLKTFADYEAKKAQRIAEEEAQKAFANRSIATKAQEQMVALKNKAVANPTKTAAIAFGSTLLAVGGMKGLQSLRTKKEEPVHVDAPTVEELYQGSSDLREFAHSLNVHGYTKADFDQAQLKTPRGGKVYIHSQL